MKEKKERRLIHRELGGEAAQGERRGEMGRAEEREGA